GDERIRITATVVRVPVIGGHSEAVNVALKKEFDISSVRKELAATEGVIVQDNVDVNVYPMPLFSEEKDAVFVGRIRRDESNPNTLDMWVVSDNLRKGAATNSVQIAEYLIDQKLI
ncbi:MAG: aspartate-semialdehyde dehydrogenase, partial [Crocinitomicaceae bacterium]|nr:aspartate-semialdehyde dehydrogenase [Crocinitomicaceae bacterium]